MVRRSAARETLTVSVYQSENLEQDLTLFVAGPRY
jgi:hypothetical protein